MIRFLLKLIGALVLVLWWVIAGFFTKILGVVKLFVRIKKIFLDKKKSQKGKKADERHKF